LLDYAALLKYRSSSCGHLKSSCLSIKNQ